MKVLKVTDLHGTSREVRCPKGGFVSVRMLLKADAMGFTMTRTTIRPTKTWQRWHYKHHFEACYCIRGRGVLKDARGRRHAIVPGVFYALDKHDTHWFKAFDTVVLICTFTPALKGAEVHRGDGSYER